MRVRFATTVACLILVGTSALAQNDFEIRREQQRQRSAQYAQRRQENIQRRQEMQQERRFQQQLDRHQLEQQRRTAAEHAAARAAEEAQAKAARAEQAENEKLSQRVKDAAATPNPDAKPDPSVKKAAKAHVDMTFFGLSLGQPLTLPACHDVTGADTSSGKNCGAVKTLSSTEGAVLDLAMATDSATRAGRFDPKRSLEDQFLVRDIQLTQANCPDWLHPEIECRVYGIFDDDGVLRGLLAPLSPEKGGELGRYLAGKFERHRKQLAKRELAIPGLYLKVRIPPGGEVPTFMAETESFHKQAPPDVIVSSRAAPPSRSPQGSRSFFPEYEPGTREYDERVSQEQRARERAAEQRIEEVEQYNRQYSNPQ